jgi:hypothetical protein
VTAASSARRHLVESRCGAVSLGRTYLFPPLSSGGAYPETSPETRRGKTLLNQRARPRHMEKAVSSIRVGRRPMATLLWLVVSFSTPNGTTTPAPEHAGPRLHSIYRGVSCRPCRWSTTGESDPFRTCAKNESYLIVLSPPLKPFIKTTSCPHPRDSGRPAPGLSEAKPVVLG